MLVLRTDSRDEEVYPCHLNYREECDEHEPGGEDLLPYSFAVHCSPDSRYLVLFVFRIQMLGA